ncbi:hypothetical protein [Nocardia wallacei]|nr:hypothetical protein [Nocardia wallacei]
MTPDDHKQPRSAGSPSQVTESDLRQLLQTGSPGTRLVLLEGRIQLVPGAADESDGLTLITRGDLAAQIGDNPGEAELTVAAETLNTEIRLQGA